MKDYVQNVEPMKSYLAKKKDSVYIEEKRRKNKVRIWLSYDVEAGHEELYDKLYAMFEDLKAEQWGNSVATFLAQAKASVKKEGVAIYIVKKCIKYGILDGESFEDNKWKKTKGLSLYVFYRYYYYDKSKEEKENESPKEFNSDHFVLLHNAPIKHLNGWK